MTETTHTISPLRQRMLDDMRLRKFAPKTQTGYICAVKHLAGYLGRSPDSATVEELRRFQLYLVDHGTSPITLNATIAGLKFFFEVTLDRPDAMARMSTVRVQRKLPVILLDTDLAENQPEDRQITDELYGRDDEYRLKQEAVL